MQTTNGQEAELSPTASNAELRSTVRAGIPKIERSQARILQGIATLQQSHNAGQLIRAIGAQDRALASLEAKLSREVPSSPAGRSARADLTKGLQLVLRSNGILIGDVKRTQRHLAVSPRSVRTAVNEARNGNRDLVRGAKLLHA